MIERTCPVCGIKFSVQPSALKFGWGKTCSNQCRYRNQSIKATAKNRTLTEKRCGRCSTMKPISEFHRKSQGRPGWRSMCKSCCSEAANIWVSLNKDRDRKARAVKMSRWRKRNSDHVSKMAKAYRRVRHAIASGKLLKQSCSLCGSSSNLVAHHEDYSRPLDIVWFCQRHHVRYHLGLSNL